MTGPARPAGAGTSGQADARASGPAGPAGAGAPGSARTGASDTAGPGLRVVAIDGPAGSGKSTVARAVARRLGLAYLDTGAMYRSVTFAALRDGLDPGDADAVARLSERIELALVPAAGAAELDRVLVDGADVTAEIRSSDVTGAVSTVAANPQVRRELVRRQREWAATRGGGVLEGRDIGTVVFPDADLKVYLTASDHERATRRNRELGDVGHDAVAADLARRDRIDRSRSASPLAVADGAVTIDTTGRSIDDIVDEVVGRL